MAYYPLELSQDGDSILVTSPSFPELTTYGSDEADAIRNGEMAIEEAVAARMETGKPVPIPLTTASRHPAAKLSPSVERRIVKYAKK